MMQPEDKVFRLWFVTELFQRMNKGNRQGLMAFQDYLKRHPPSQDFGWGPDWFVVELRTPEDVEEFLGVLTGVVPFA
ncbi:MAG: hypothetical protein FJ125_11405 [Deltaproteobacteria bacterium]|nr:hypothetical protein [Deltaproteobacteria bacterium]